MVFTLDLLFNKVIHLQKFAANNCFIYITLEHCIGLDGKLFMSLYNLFSLLNIACNVFKM